MPELLTANPTLPSLMAAPTARAAVAATPAAERASPTQPTPPGAKSASEARPASPGESGQEAQAGNNGQPPSFAAVLRKQMAPAKGETAAANTTVDPTLLIEQSAGVPTAGEVQALLPFIEQMMPLLMAKGERESGPGTVESSFPGIGSGTDGGLAVTGLPALMNATVSNVALSPRDESIPQDRLLNVASEPEIALDTAISAETAASSAATTMVDENDFSALIQRAGEQLASTQHQSAASPRTGGAETTVRMDTPVGHKDWSTELGNKLTWMATAQRQQADLVLNPPQLGRVEVSLTVSGDQASAVFASPNAAVRELIEDSLPRLKEILSGAGINLGEAQVGSESPSRFGNPAGENGRGQGLREDHMPPGLATPQPVAAEHRNLRAGLGMVDIFA